MRASVVAGLRFEKCELGGGVRRRTSIPRAGIVQSPCIIRRLASYSAGSDIAAESEPSTGTKLDIAATDQIRPIATTIPTIHARICIPSTSR